MLEKRLSRGTSSDFLKGVFEGPLYLPECWMDGVTIMTERNNSNEDYLCPPVRTVMEEYGRMTFVGLSIISGLYLMSKI